MTFIKCSLVAAALAIATPAIAQSATYPTSGNAPYGAESVTIDRGSQTITWHLSNGNDFTEARTSDFNDRVNFIFRYFIRDDGDVRG